MEQLRIPGLIPEKKTYRFVIYYNYAYLGIKEVKAISVKQAWAILYKVFPQIKTKGYKVVDLYEVK